MTKNKKARKWLFKSDFPVGDLVTLSAIIRDIHKSYPNEFITDVACHAPEIWDNNPYLTKLSEQDPDVLVIDQQFPSVECANRQGHHLLTSFLSQLNADHNLNIELTRFHGDIHLGPEDKNYPATATGLAQGTPYWIIVSGGKHDFTVKWWDHNRLQEVVDHFNKRVIFVQVGHLGAFHPPLSNVIDLRFKSNIRELIQLVNHAEGVLTPISFPMHLVNAIPQQPGRIRHCITIAGGREPANFFSYPNHQVVHTVGSLPCCEMSGCWKSRTLPLRDNHELDSPIHLCENVTESALPRCMDLIKPHHIIRIIEDYLEGESCRPLTSEQWKTAKTNLSPKFHDAILGIIQSAQTRVIH